MSAFRRGTNKPYSRPTSRGDVNSQWVHDKAPTGPRSSVVNGNPRPAPMHPAEANTKLLVSNLHYEITAKDLASIFGTIGTLVRDPIIRYDRSGRSSGTAIISFETAAEATRAKKQFDGILAKGQPMTIAFDTMPTRPRRTVSSPGSLLNRVQGLPLLSRLSQDDSHIKPRGGGAGPVRNRPARGRGGGGDGGRRGPKKPKTADELDKELDAFMGDAEPAASAQDIEMA